MESGGATPGDAFWRERPIRTDEEFQERVAEALDNMVAARRAGELEACRDWGWALRRGGTLASGGPRLDYYRSSLALSSALAAGWLAAGHSFDSALPIIVQSWHMLDEHEAGRREAGLPPPDSQRPRWELLGVLAGIKWRAADPQLLAKLLAPDDQLARWLEFAAGFTGDEAGLVHSAADSLLWCGLHVALCAARAGLDARLAAFLGRWNSLHRRVSGRDGLELEPGHWRSAAAGQRDVWYWAFEVGKGWLAGDLSREDLDYLYGRFAAAARDYPGTSGDEVFLAGIECDREWMRAGLPEPEGAPARGDSVEGKLPRLDSNQ